jgi:Domain of unknown function (DUF4303)
VKKADREELTQLIKEGARKAFSEVRTFHPDKELFGYCLYSDDSALTLLHIVGHRPEKPSPRAEDEYWNPHEWQLQEGLEHLKPAQDWLTKHQASVDDEEYEEYTHSVFEAGSDALAVLRKEGFFSDQSYVLFSVSDWSEDDVFEWVERLNPKPIVENYKSWMDKRKTPVSPVARSEPREIQLTEKDFHLLKMASKGRTPDFLNMSLDQYDKIILNEAFVLAARKGKLEKCQHLLAAGADPCHVGYRYSTALDIAKQEKRHSVVELLLELVGDQRNEPDVEFRKKYDDDIFTIA